MLKMLPHLRDSEIQPENYLQKNSKLSNNQSETQISVELHVTSQVLFRILTCSRVGEDMMREVCVLRVPRYVLLQTVKLVYSMPTICHNLLIDLITESCASKAVSYGAVPVLLQMFCDWQRTDHHHRQTNIRKAILNVIKNITMSSMLPASYCANLQRCSCVCL